MANIKKTQLVSGILLLSIGVIIFLLGLSLSLFQQNVILANPWTLTAVFVLFSIIFVESGYYWTKESVKISEEKINSSNYNDNINIASQIASVSKYVDLSLAVGFIIALGIFIYIYVSNFIEGSLSINIYLFAQIVVYFLYFFVLRKIFIKTTKSLNSMYPNYSVYDDHIEINLNINNIQDRTKKYIVKINFNELDEINELSYVEAKSLIEYKVGPNLTLQTASVKDRYKYLKNDIKRPDHYIFGPASNAKNLVLKGKNIFYLITVKNDNNTELLNKFNKYKKR